jgi:predicted RNA-binding protein with PUA-like domain
VSFWLVKSEPDAFSWDQQVANGVEPWTGVRNYMARNNLRAMKKGDRAFFYHSNIGKEIVGVVEVVREAYPDPTAEGGDWVCVDMKAVGPVKTPLTLAEMKADPALEGFALRKFSRLSVAPVSDEHWVHICKRAGFPVKRPRGAKAA